MFDDTDPWVEQVRKEQPDSPIFVSKNHRYWAVPWFTNDQPRKLLGLWMLDKAYFEPTDEAPLSPPSFTLTYNILQSFANSFLRYLQPF